MKQVWLRVAIAIVLGGVLALPAAAQEGDARPPRGSRVHVVQPQGWLGIAFSYEREGSGGRARERAVITEVHPGSPAAQAGLQRGDAIVRLNGRDDVEAQVRGLRLQPGDTVRVRVQRQGQRDRDVALVAGRRPPAVGFGPGQREGQRFEIREGQRFEPREGQRFEIRDGQRFEVRRLPGGEPGVIIINGDTVRIPVDSLMLHADSIQRHIRVLIADSLGPRLRMLERRVEHELQPALREQMRMLDSTVVRAFPDGFVFEVGRRAVAGAEFTELNPALAEYFDGAREGVLVTRVAPESPAARAGLQPGDVVVRANGEAVRTTAELRRRVAAAGRDEVRLGVVRKGRQVEVRVR